MDFHVHEDTRSFTKKIQISFLSLRVFFVWLRGMERVFLEIYMIEIVATEFTKAVKANE